MPDNTQHHRAQHTTDHQNKKYTTQHHNVHHRAPHNATKYQIAHNTTMFTPQSAPAASESHCWEMACWPPRPQFWGWIQYFIITWLWNYWTQNTSGVSQNSEGGVFWSVFLSTIISTCDTYWMSRKFRVGILGKGGPEDMKVAFVTKKIWASPAFLLSQTKSCRCWRRVSGLGLCLVVRDSRSAFYLARAKLTLPSAHFLFKVYHLIQGIEGIALSNGSKIPPCHLALRILTFFVE